ncbi:MAG TPA: sporulation inhibitor of replication protein SirA [Mollicutes bacterium]|nr:sporulation inhibitor of replication protein SirA [Mollicutes bacterium]
MRTFYLFKVNEDYSKLTRNIPYNLYSTYLDIKLSSKNNLDYLFNQYKSITDYLKPKLINQFLFNKMKDMDGYSLYKNIHMYNNYYSDEVSKLKVYNSYFILESNKQNSTFFSLLQEIPYLFVIDFENKDYFWLKSFKNLRLV